MYDYGIKSLTYYFFLWDSPLLIVAKGRLAFRVMLKFFNNQLKLEKKVNLFLFTLFY